MDLFTTLLIVYFIETSLNFFLQVHLFPNTLLSQFFELQSLMG